MNRIDIFTDIASLFDLRRGIITHIAREHNPNFTWSLFDPIYQKRKMDYFIREDIGITPEKYKERYSRISIDDWADEKECYFYPTHLTDSMLQIVRGLEYGETATILMDKLTLTVNTYPFEFSEELRNHLYISLKGAFKIPIDIRFVRLVEDELTGPYLNNYHYVFRYDQLISEKNKVWFDTLKDIRNLGTKYIVPDLLAKNYDPESAGVLRSVSVKEHIGKLSAVMGGTVFFIPVDKKIYQFKDKF